jgi:PAS domain S-box-containing protein
MLRAVFEEAPSGILVADLAGVVLGVNRTFAGMLGYTPAELHRKNVADIVQEEDYRALMQELLSGGRDAVTSARRYRGKSRAVLLAREHSVLRRDSTGRPRYVFSYVEKMIEAGRGLLERLSRREREVLEAVIKGRSSKEIAARLGISAASVDTYRSRIMKKLHIKDLPGLVRFAIRQGIASI